MVAVQRIKRVSEYRSHMHITFPYMLLYYVAKDMVLMTYCQLVFTSNVTLVKYIHYSLSLHIFFSLFFFLSMLGDTIL